MKFRKREDWNWESITWEELIGFEKALWQEYQRERNKKSRAKIGLVAFIVSLLMRRPLRARTLCTIRLSRNLVTRETDAGGEKVFRFFPKENLKCGEEIIEMSFPKILEPKLDVFLKEIRPLLMDKRTGDYFLPGLNGGVLASGIISKLLMHWSTKLLGKTLNSHAWRHLYATIRLRKDPSKLYSVSKMLMISSTAMIQKIYSGYREKDAGEDLDRLMGEK